MQYFGVTCEACSVTTDGYEIFNVRTNFGMCHTHEMTVEHKKKCIIDDSEGEEKKVNWPSPCNARGSNPGSSGLNSDAPTSSSVG